MTDASPNTRPNTRSVNWTRRETLAALHLYLQLPYGQLHRSQPRIVQLSQWLGRTANAVALKLVNLASHNSRCCMSGLSLPRLLVASHIVPWSMDTQNRLNPSNGLCLSALHDRAYDQGLITVLPDFTIRVAEDLRRPDLDALAQSSLAQCQGQQIRLQERFRPAPVFLEAHARRFGFL